jgi:hypothetical protein
MPVHLTEKDGKYCVTEPDGTVKKCYTSKQEALQYLQAININTMDKSKAEELPTAIRIVSGGTPETTFLFIHGIMTKFSSMEFSCEEGGCEMEISTTMTGEDGMTIERKFKLRPTGMEEGEEGEDEEEGGETEASSFSTLAAKILDPQAKVRNRGDVVFPANSKKIKDNKDHFPINDADQARNALSRVAQFDSVPPWYDGTLSELQAAVRNAVSRKFKGIKVTK